MKKIIILLACIALGLQVNAQDNGTSLYWQVKIYDPSQMGAHYPVAADVRWICNPPKNEYLNL